MIIYSKNSNLNNAAFGKIQTPIRMVIENESDLLSKKGGIRDWLFNVEKSNKFGAAKFHWFVEKKSAKNPHRTLKNGRKKPHAGKYLRFLPSRK